jgi:uncharacterized damage-inducible protein DinB
MTDALIKIYDRDIERLKKEIESFTEENNLWRITGNIKNSAGNLCLHLVGNLNHYIGKNIGNSDYKRDRDAEFSLKNMPKQELVKQVEETKKIVLSALKKITEKDLQKNHVENVFGYEMTNEFFLVHLATHLSYHLGQINYIRRILE